MGGKRLLVSHLKFIFSLNSSIGQNMAEVLDSDSIHCLFDLHSAFHENLALS